MADTFYIHTSGTGDLGGTATVPVVEKIQGRVVSAPPGGTADFLRADGSWAVPPGSGGGGGGTAAYVPSDPTGATDMTSELEAFRVANPGMLVKVADGSTIKLKNCFAGVTAGDILLDFSNCTVLYDNSTSSDYAIACDNTGNASAEVAVSSLALVDWIAPGAVDTSDTITQVTLGSTLSASRFDWIALYSTDANPAISGGQYGEIFQLLADESSLVLTATRKLNSHPFYATSVKARKLDATRRVYIRGGIVKASGNTEDHTITARAGGILVQGFADPLVEGVTFDHPWSYCVRFQCCAQPRARDITVRNVGNLAAFTGYTYGVYFYGMNDGGDARNLVVRNGRHAAFTTDGNSSNTTTWYAKGIPTNLAIQGVHGFNCHGSVIDTHEEGDAIVIDGVIDFHPYQDADIAPNFQGLGCQIRAANVTLRNFTVYGGTRGIKVVAVNHGFEDQVTLEGIAIMSTTQTAATDGDTAVVIDDQSGLAHKRHVYFDGTMNNVGLGFSVGKTAKLTIRSMALRRFDTAIDAGAGSIVTVTGSASLDYRNDPRTAPYSAVLCRSDTPNGGCSVVFLTEPVIIKGDNSPAYLFAESDTTATKLVYASGIVQYNAGAFTPTVLQNPSATTLSPAAVTDSASGGGGGGGISPPAGDIGGTALAPTVAKIQGTAISSPPGGTTQFLRGDGSWTVPPGTGGSGSGLPVFNVKNYGALGDGATQDSTAVQNAADDALAAGGILFFPPGTYVMSGISFGSSLIVQGSGQQGVGIPSSVNVTASSATMTVTGVPAALYPVGEPVILTAATAPAGFTAGTTYYVVSSSWSSGSGGTFSFQLSLTAGGGNITPTSTGTTVGVQAVGSGGTVLLFDPALKTFDSAGTNHQWVCRVSPASPTTYTSFLTMRDLTIDGNSALWSPTDASKQRIYGFYCGQGPGLTDPVTNITMQNVTIQHCRTYAFDIENAGSLLLINCVAANNGFPGVGTLNASNADGFTLIGNDCTMIGCQSYGNAERGIIAGQSATTYTRIEVRGCESWGNGGEGLLVSSGSAFTEDGVIVSGGRYFSNGDSGIVLKVNTNASSITGAYCYGNAAAGIIVETSQSVTVTGNTCYGNQTQGIGIDGSSYVAVTGNACWNNAVSAATQPEIYLYTSSTNCAVTGNTITSANAEHAISEQAGGGTDRNVITGNVVTSTNTPVISVAGPNTYVSGNQGYAPGGGADVGPGKTFTGKVITPSLQVTTGFSAGLVLTSDASGNAAWSSPTGSQLAVGIRTGAATVGANTMAACDTTSAGFTLTLPSAPATGTQFAAKIIAQGLTSGVGNAVTVACGGTDTINKTSGSTSMTLSLLGQGATLQYKAGGSGPPGVWYIINDDLPLGQLDERFGVTVTSATWSASTAAVARATAGVWNVTLGNASTAVTLTAAPYAAAVAQTLTLFLRQPASGTTTFSATWPGSVTWLSGSAPTIATGASALTVVALMTPDGGTTWYGSLPS